LTFRWVARLQLLRSTGPVAPELGGGTLGAVVRMLVTLLTNRSYMDVGLQWYARRELAR
jgi:hypothetical protein